ncbi:MAG: VWA domain-containing protein [Pseudomonadota bacterium]
MLIKRPRWFWRSLVAAVAFFALPALSAGAKRNSCIETAMIVFDASGSMGVSHRGSLKIATARAAVTEVLPDITGVRETGLVTYAGCSRVEMRVAPALNTDQQITAALQATPARGSTPLARAVARAQQTLAERGGKGVIVLVTDGLESCSGRPCRLAQRIASITPGITVHVIGFALTPEIGRQHLRCLTEATGGVYAHADDNRELSAALRKLLGCPMLS